MAWSRDDVVRSYRWLALQPVAEVNALSPEYRAGDVVRSRLHQAFPVIAYVASLSSLLQFVSSMLTNAWLLLA